MPRPVLFALALTACSGSNAAPQPDAAVAAPSGFLTNPDFEATDLSSWSGGDRTCGQAVTRTAAQVAAAQIGGRPPGSVGGDYWITPFATFDGIGNQGHCWLSAPAGGASSTAFQSPARYLSFRARTTTPAGVQIDAIVGGASIAHVAIPEAATMSLYTLDLQAPQATLTLRLSGLVDVDDFQATDAPLPPLSPGSSLGESVWGTADLHAHLWADRGWGGVLFHGQLFAPGVTDPDAAMAQALSWCTDAHGPGGAFITMEQFHLVSGYPQLDGWPSYTSMIHQAAYVDWLKRAWLGGLRLVATPIGNHEYVARTFHAVNPTAPPMKYAPDDASAIETELDYAYELAAGPGLGWAEIALTPADARRIISQGKLAIVLAIELEAIGNFYTDADLPDSPDGYAKLRTYLEHLYARGIRQITPIHMSINAFGAPAVYNRFFDIAGYPLTHAFYPLRNGFAEGIRYREDLDFQFTQLIAELLTGIPPIDQNPGRYGDVDGSDVGHATDQGLTPQGKALLGEMMRLGMIIDTDHMSDRSTEDALAAVEALPYPGVIGSHASFRELAFGWDQAHEFKNDDATHAAYGTANTDRVANEMQKTAAQVERIRALGGVIGLGVKSDEVERTWNPAVPQTCDGSSRAWVQRYLYALDKMHGQGVMLGTDVNGLPGLPNGRFGTFACAAAQQADPTRALVLTAQADAQATPVAYDTPMTTARAFRFEGPAKAFGEEEIWLALTLAASAQDIDSYDLGYGFGTIPYFDVKRLAHAFRLGLAGQTSTDTDPPSQLAWALAAGAPTTANPANGDALRHVFAHWTLIAHATGVPIQRHFAGLREFDVNVDGFAHYGLMPDFLQDVKNLGLSPEQMAPLFHGAEDYLVMWEAARARSQAARTQYP